MQEVKIGSRQATGKIARNGGRSLDVSEEDRVIARALIHGRPQVKLSFVSL